MLRIGWVKYQNIKGGVWKDQQERSMEINKSQEKRLNSGSFLPSDINSTGTLSSVLKQDHHIFGSRIAEKKYSNEKYSLKGAVTHSFFALAGKFIMYYTHKKKKKQQQ